MSVTTENITDGIDLNGDRLTAMFALQSKLQERLGTWDRIKDNPSMKQQMCNQMFIALIEESIEVIRETPYKNPDFVPFGWKKTQLGDPEKFKEEIVDLFHFFMNFCLLAEMTPEDLYVRYLAKNRVNHVRQDAGY
jgi:dimeric dUTPase (all-alpha-NTP-PPase superfamily)